MFDDTFVGCILDGLRSRRSPFTYNYHNHVGSRTRGLYAFWCHKRCLYVGMSIDIARRIYQHRMQEHNIKLEKLFSAFARDIEVSYVHLGGKSDRELSQIEKMAIRAFRPMANIKHN